MVTRAEERAIARVLTICLNEGIKFSRLMRGGAEIVRGDQSPRLEALQTSLAAYKAGVYVRTKTSAETAHKIIALLQSGATVKEAAQKYSVPLNTVYRIRSGKYPGAPSGGHPELNNITKRGRPKKAA